MLVISRLVVVVGMAGRTFNRADNRGICVCWYSIGDIVRDGWLKFEVNKQYLRNSIWFSLMPHTLGGVIIMTDRLYNQDGRSKLGLYTVGYR